MAIVTVKNLAQLGVISDIAPFESPPNAWTSARNVSFGSWGVSKSGARTKVLTSPISKVNKIYPKDERLYFGTEDKLFMALGTGNIDISRTVGAYTPTPEWFATELSNVLVFSNDSNIPQMLKPNAIAAEDLTGWDASWRTSKIRAYKNFLLAIQTTEGGSSFPQRVRWSDLAMPNAAPDSWDASDTTKSAGFNDLSEAKGELVDGLPLGDYFVLYTTKEVYLISYVAGNDIFSFRKIFDDLSILSTECVTAVNGGHFLVTASDIVIHNGSSYTSIITDKIRKELFSVISSSDTNKVKVQYNPSTSEVWVFYPSTKNSFLDRAVIYNLTNQTWTFRELPSVTAITYGVVPPANNGIIDDQMEVYDADHSTYNGVGADFVKNSLVVANSALEWWALDEGGSGDVNLPCSVIKNNLDFDDWGVEATRHKQIKTIYPQFSGRGTVMISVGVSETPHDPPSWTDPYEFHIEEDRKADFRVTGRYISVRFESFGSEQWSLLSYSIEGIPKGIK